MNCAEHPGNGIGRLHAGDASQEVVDRAQDALMAAHGCTAQVAAGILTGVARSSGTGLRAVAEKVVAVAERHAQAPPDAIRAAITWALRNALP
ncbi:ANTAR domain-containing protein [Streptomyces sp. HNM0575]|uniref:ANTAR domain-containing protein n=1 Tax=Streptomyces sp. HNM0575 TaxID=2716338 RepID=UPI00145FC7CC|nr:ANTAR domain-containing protein [Streptomyces sp. HNM0575]